MNKFITLITWLFSRATTASVNGSHTSPEASQQYDLWHKLISNYIAAHDSGKESFAVTELLSVVGFVRERSNAENTLNATRCLHEVMASLGWHKKCRKNDGRTEVNTGDQVEHLFYTRHA